MNRCVRLVGAVQRERDGPGGVAPQMDDVEGQLTDRDGVAVGEDAIGRDRQRFGVELMRRGRHAGRLGHLVQRKPVVLVLVAGQDQREFRGVLLDQFQQDFGLIGRVDE